MAQVVEGTDSADQFIVRKINGKENPDAIPEYLPIRVYLNSFASTAQLFKSEQEHIESIMKFNELDENSARRMRDTLLELRDLDTAMSRNYSTSLCSHEFLQEYKDKDVGEFLDYLLENETGIHQELVDRFRSDLQEKLSEPARQAILDWIDHYTIPSINHVEIDKKAYYLHNNITPEKFQDSFCRGKP